MAGVVPGISVRAPAASNPLRLVLHRKRADNPQSECHLGFLTPRLYGRESFLSRLSGHRVDVPLYNHGDEGAVA